MGSHFGPKYAQRASNRLPDDYVQRARDFVASVGQRKARDALGVNDSTLDAMVHKGLLRPTTVERLKAKLDQVAPVDKTAGEGRVWRDG